MAEESPFAKVVDLRRWREERERRLREATGGENLAFEDPPDRIGWFYRVLALVSGLGFLSLGVVLALLPWLIHGSGDEPVSVAFLPLLLILVSLGFASALFGVDLLGRAFVGREWMRELGERVTGWLDRRIHPLPVFAGISMFVLTLGLWGGAGDLSWWEPALYWFVGYLHITLHELGHLLAVRVVKYQPRLLMAGPLTLEWERDRLAARPTRSWRFLFGGNVWFSAPRRTRARDLIVLIAGPLANLLTVVAVLGVDRLLRGSPLFEAYVRANLACAALVLLVNLLPLPRTAEGYATDGRQILDLLRGRRIA
ncbi:MAG TPA: hypothetical protein VG477_15600 [Thermoanaerobaculia bacterium]|nr:hypothetical protein [Thermoanaerobaculia bacterium]